MAGQWEQPPARIPQWVLPAWEQEAVRTGSTKAIVTEADRPLLNSYFSSRSAALPPRKFLFAVRVVSGGHRIAGTGFNPRPYKSGRFC